MNSEELLLELQSLKWKNDYTKGIYVFTNKLSIFNKFDVSKKWYDLIIMEDGREKFTKYAVAESSDGVVLYDENTGMIF